MKKRKLAMNASCWVFETVEMSRPMPSPESR